MKIGLISDTHGLMREAALTALRGSDLIIHAGDVGSPAVLDALRALAAVVAVRGNIDRQSWAASLPVTTIAQAGPARIYVLHNLHDLDFNPAEAGFHLVVSGHSHQPGRTDLGGVIYINPGSAGPRRFKLPVTVVRLNTGSEPWKVKFVEVG